MADYKNLKDWNDGDKLTGIDYTYERDAIVDKAVDIDEQRIKKESDIFVLSRYKPENSYIDTIWMNPNQFNLNRNFNNTVINTIVDVSGFTTTIFTKGVDTVVTTTAQSYGYKLDDILGTNVDYPVQTNITVSGYKVEQNRKDAEYTVTTNASGDFYKQYIQREDIDYSVLTNVTPIVYKQQQSREDVDYTVISNASGEFYKQQQSREDVDYTVTTTVSGEFYKQQQERQSLDYTVTTNFSGDFYKQDYEKISIVKNIYTNVTFVSFKNLKAREDVDYIVTANISENAYKSQQAREDIDYVITTSVPVIAYKSQQEREDISYDITTTVSGDFYKQEQKKKDVDYTFTTNASGTGYKQERKQKPVTYDVTSSASGTGYKSYDVFAASSIPFTQNFTFDGTSRSVTVDNGFEFLNTQRTGTTVQFDGPQIIKYNNIDYQLSEVVWEIGPNTSDSTQTLPRTITVNGTVYINFIYEEVPTIIVSSKAISTPETQFGPVDITFRTLQNNIIVNESTESVEQQYLQSHSFYDYPGNDLKIILDNPTYTAGAWQYTWKTIKVYDDFNNLEQTYTNTGSTTPEFTFEPNQIATYQSMMYVEVEYDAVEMYTVKLRLSGAPSLYVSGDISSTTQNPDINLTLYGGDPSQSIGSYSSNSGFNLVFQRYIQIYGTTLEFSMIWVGSTNITSNVTVQYSTIGSTQFVGIVGKAANGTAESYIDFDEFANLVAPYNETEFTIYYS